MKKIQLKEIVFLGIISAALLLLSGIAAPFVMTSHQLGLQQVAMAIIYGIVGTVALRKVPKVGALIIVGLFTGLVLLFMAPVMLFNQVLGALIAEVIAWLIYRSYDSKKAVMVAAGLYTFWTIPITAVMNIWLKDRSIAEQIGSPWVCLLLVVGTVVLGLIGSMIGHKLSDELQKAGKL